MLETDAFDGEQIGTDEADDRSRGTGRAAYSVAGLAPLAGAIGKMSLPVGLLGGLLDGLPIGLLGGLLGGLPIGLLGGLLGGLPIGLLGGLLGGLPI